MKDADEAHQSRRGRGKSLRFLHEETPNPSLGGRIMSINASAFQSAMKAALKGPEKKLVKFRNHDFHIRPVSVSRNGGSVSVQGHMFHQLKLRPDDKIIYSFKKVNGAVQNLDIRFEKGIDKLVKTVGEIIELAGKVATTIQSLDEKSDAVPGGLPLNTPAPGTEELLADDGWKAESRFLIANVAVRIN
jgi:hypothetical protein